MNGVIVFNSNPINIGDYMQSLAAYQFYNKVDYYIDRENVSSFKAEGKVDTIMNAWWMWSRNWPPSPSINPLFVSFHINPNAAKWMLNEEGIKYLKAYQPIGCRDKGTMTMLQEKGIEAYFSGCLTLTLGRTVKLTKQKQNLMGGAE